MKHDIGAKFCLNSASQLCLSTLKKRPLSIMRLLGFDSAQESAKDIMFKVAKKLIDLFPRVPQTDAILFIGQCHGLSHGKMHVSSRPMECKMTTLMIDGSNEPWAICSKIVTRKNGRFFPTYTCNHFCSVGLFFPSVCPFSSHASVPCKHTLNKHAYICAQQEPIYMGYKQTSIWGHSRSSYKRHRIIPSAITLIHVH